MGQFVMFGFGGLFGELLDIVHLNGGRVSKVVLNVAEVIVPNKPSLKERLSQLPYSVAVESIEDFVPCMGERYFIGFKGVQMAPLKDRLKSEFFIEFTSLIHPTAILSPTLNVGEGSVIGAGVVIGSHTVLGNHVVINRGATIGHDVSIEDYAFIGPSSVICGGVRIQEGATVFANATVIEDRVIGSHARIAAGAVCLTNALPYSLMAGVPAVMKKQMQPSLVRGCLQSKVLSI